MSLLKFKRVSMPKASDERGKVQRQNHVKRLLSHTSEDSALSITELAQALQGEGYKVTRKTIERDILDISIDYPLSETASNPRRFYFDGEFKIDFELLFDENQLQTIVLALQTLKQVSPGVLKSLCTDVEGTLMSKLPNALGKEFNHLKSLSYAGATVLGEGGDIEPGVFQTVLVALRKGFVFECQYVSPDDAGTSKRVRKFAPLKLHFAGAPYIYVYDCENDVIKLLRISRISKIKMLEQKVNRKRAEEINLEHVFGGYGKGTEKVIHYEVTCSQPMALRFKDHKIHPSQKIEVLKDGLFRITFSVHDSLEMIRLLAQYGEFIKNVKPDREYEKIKEIWKKGLSAA